MIQSIAIEKVSIQFTHDKHLSALCMVTSHTHTYRSCTPLDEAIHWAELRVCVNCTVTLDCITYRAATLL